MDRTADEIRIRYLYRGLVLRGKVALSLEAARRLIGPNCAYNLYSTMSGKKTGRKRKESIAKVKM
jgi:hypothetical protein